LRSMASRPAAGGGLVEPAPRAGGRSSPRSRSAACAARATAWRGTRP
jgi:hypothetical protein